MPPVPIESHRVGPILEELLDITGQVIAIFRRTRTGRQRATRRSRVETVIAPVAFELVEGQTELHSALLAPLDFAELRILVDEVNVFVNIDRDKATEKLNRTTQVGRTVPFVANDDTALGKRLSLLATDEIDLRVGSLDNKIRISPCHLRKYGHARGSAHSYESLWLHCLCTPKLETTS